MASSKTLTDLIQRYYTKELDKHPDKTVYDLFEWDKRDVVLRDYMTGEILTEMHDVEFPAGYSQNAVDIVVSKYFRKAGVPETGHETSFRQLVHRMSDFWVAALVDEKMITDEEAKILYDEIAHGILSQKFAPNSPQWFNTGLKRTHGIAGGKSGLFYYDLEEGKVKVSEDDYTRTQASACFILSINDSLLGPHSITEAYVTETRLFKGGSGTGSNFSNIRGKNEGLSGGGVSSGLMSFLRGLDRNAGAIKSGGTTRRAAKMVCLDVDHPDIKEFINWKSEEEDKALALIKMGYDSSMDGEAYSTVSGQNSNNSVRFSNEFMEKVANLEEDPEATITLKGRVDDSVKKEVKVADLWEQFNYSAWRCADPAPQFDDTFNEWHTCPAGSDGELGAKHNRINGTNPCGEYAFLDDTSCNLASINVFRFYDLESKKFDIQGFKHIVSIVQLVLEASIHWGQFPTEAIALRTHQFRTTGLGMANLASLLMVMGLPYDSIESRMFSAALMAILTGQSYATSALEAERVGSFEPYELNKEHMLRVIRNHARAAGARTDKLEGLSYEPLMINHKILESLGLTDLSKTVKDVWKQAEDFGNKYGYRNAQVSVIAPTGTISFAMDCGATSIEPFFSHISYKKLIGGGFMVITNPVIAAALENLGYSEEEVNDIVEYIERKDENGMIIDGKIEGAPHLKEEHLSVFDTANVAGSGKRFIAPRGHVLMVAALTPFVSGAISKTVNLPNIATVDDFKEVHLLSWKTGVKGITLYRDGCKNSQPLNNTYNPGTVDQKLEDLSYAELLKFAHDAQDKLTGNMPVQNKRTKLLGIRSGHTHPASIDGVKIYATVNRDESGNISEIYITTDREGTTIMGLLNSLSKTISIMLQYHIPPERISKLLRGQKYEPYGFVQRHPYIKSVSSVSDFISKVIDIELGDYTRVQVKPDGYDGPDSKWVPNQLTERIENQKAIYNDLEDDEELPSFDIVATTQAAVAFDEFTDETEEYDDDFVHSYAEDLIEEGERLYDGSTCSTCSSTRLVQNGTCKVCLDCGTTTGCS